MKSRLENIRSAIIDVPNYPKPGIVFKDITPLFSNASLFQDLISELASAVSNLEFHTFVAVESRGFILGSALAHHLKKGMVLVRKKNKLPRERISQSYALEYGTDILEMHKGDLKPGQKTIVIDDILATGGTARATAELIEQSRAQTAAFLFLMELEFLRGKENLQSPVYSLLRY